MEEAKTMLKLKSHPSLPTVFGICPRANREAAKLVLQLYKTGGGEPVTLRQVVKGKVKIFDGRNIFLSLAGGLSASTHQNLYIMIFTVGPTTFNFFFTI